jgi:hypothetical protein
MGKLKNVHGHGGRSPPPPPESATATVESAANKNISHVYLHFPTAPLKPLTLPDTRLLMMKSSEITKNGSEAALVFTCKVSND